MTERIARHKSIFSYEHIVSKEFTSFYVYMAFQVDAERFIEYDPVLYIWTEVSRSDLRDRIENFVTERPVLCTPSSTTIHFYDKVAQALERKMAYKVVQTPGIMTKYGFLNYLTKTIEPPSYQVFCFHRIEDSLRTDMEMRPLTKQFFATLCNGSPLQIFALREWLKRLLLGDNRDQVALHLMGIPGCGKSKFAELLLSLLGNEATVIELHNLSAPFGLGSIVGKKLIIIPDPPVDGMNSKRASIVRMLISGEPVTVNEKYLKAFSYNFKGNMLFHSNNSLLSSRNLPEDQSGLARRVLEMPCNTMPKKQMPDLMDHLEKDQLAIIWWALTSNVSSNVSNVNTLELEKTGFLHNYIHDLNDLFANDVQDVFTDFVLEHLKENCNVKLPLGVSSTKVTNNLWTIYCHYCHERELEKVSTQVFSKLLLTALRTLGINVAKIHTKTGMVIKGIDFYEGTPIIRKNTRSLQVLDTHNPFEILSSPLKTLPAPIDVEIEDVVIEKDPPTEVSFPSHSTLSTPTSDTHSISPKSKKRVVKKPLGRPPGSPNKIPGKNKNKNSDKKADSSNNL